MSERTVRVTGDDVATLENALDAVDADDDLPDVHRGRGRPGSGSISTGEAVALLAKAWTGWSA